MIPMTDPVAHVLDGSLHAAFDEALAITGGGQTATILRLENATAVLYLAVVGRLAKAKLLTYDGRQYIASPYVRIVAP